jgi:CBS domain-containing protein
VKVGEVMVRDIVTIDAGATLFEAAQRMREANVGVLPLVDAGGEMAGVVTDRDLVVRGMARNANALTTPVSEVASTTPVCASAEWTLEQAMEVMAQEQIGRLPVIDDHGRVIGIITLSSLVLRAGRAEDDALRAAQEVARRSARA